MAWGLSFAQGVENIRLRLDGENLIISYDLIGNENELYKVTPYCSHNNYAEPIKNIKGDVGNDISPGKGKEFTWQAKSELGEYAGSIQIRITAEPIPFIVFDIEHKLKRGKETIIRWEGGSGLSKLKFELFREDKLIKTFQEVNNTGSWRWEVPKDIKPGIDFTFKAISVNRFSISKSFAISRKVPLFFKVVPILGGIGGLIAILTSGKGSGGKENVNNIVDPLLPN